jgi:micrococcal nuclease
MNVRVWPTWSVARGIALSAALAVATAASPAQEALAVQHGTALPTAPSATARTGHTADVVVAGVSDGDTVTAIIDGRSMRLRLSRIDAPEHRQAWGQRAEQSLRELVWKKPVHIEWREVDRNGRPIVTMTVDGLDVSEEQVRRGMAWVYRAYSKDPRLLGLEALARESRLGLWTDESPMPPWEWRRLQREGQQVP